MKAGVVIIGAGPGGGMAAYRLASTGLKVALLEQERLPRHKACGGALSNSVRYLFDWDLTPFGENEVAVRKNFRNYTHEEHTVQVAPFLLVSRARFDAHLVERAVALGNGSVTVHEGFRVTQVEETANEISIRGENGELIQAEFLIAADGAFSITARRLGLNRNVTRGVAIDAEVRVTPEVYEARRQTATFNFFCLPQGYGWIFPKKENLLSCGICAWGGHPHLSQEIKDFLAKSLPPGSIREVETYGHPIPLYSGHRRIATHRVCLVGDAANLVDPIMGEGIHFALMSGTLAAEVIAGLMSVGSNATAEFPIPPWGKGDCRIYQSLIHTGIGRNLDNLRRFVQYIFLDAPEFFYRKFVLDGLNYAQMAQGLAQRLDESIPRVGSRR